MSTNGAVILAAGAGSRMGMSKWRLMAGGLRFVDRLALTFTEAGFCHITVVASPDDAPALSQSAGDYYDYYEVVENPVPDSAMFASLLVGLGHLGPRVDRLFVTPVDCPLVSLATVRALLAASLATPHNIIVPHYRGLPGHPVVYPAAMFPALATWSGEDGARGLLAAHAHFVEKVDVNDAEVLTDIDEPADYDALVARLERSAR